MRNTENCLKGVSENSMPPSDAASEIKAMKERLRNYRSLNRDIENNIERLERLEDKMYSVSSPNLSSMPRSPRPCADRFAELVARKDEMVEKIECLIAKRDAERVSLERILAKLVNPDERAVIEMRYIDEEEWDDIIEMLFGCKENFGDSYDNYKQRTFRLHSSAIANMALFGVRQ